ncbi:hypothetical protein F903_01764 [Acinetobacter sp. NIPH 298]|nr:hypothetical protein F903_01764 [Acinetobacter sp. NIPH 298]
MYLTEFIIFRISIYPIFATYNIEYNILNISDHSNFFLTALILSVFQLFLVMRKYSLNNF